MIGSKIERIRVLLLSQLIFNDSTPSHRTYPVREILLPNGWHAWFLPRGRELKSPYRHCNSFSHGPASIALRGTGRPPEFSCILDIQIVSSASPQMPCPVERIRIPRL